MAYCRFQNTYNNLQECYDIMANDDKPLSESEEKYKQKLLKLCKDIALDFCELTEDDLG